MTPESKVKAKVKALAKRHGAYLRAPIAGAYGMSGQLDFYGCHNGRYIGVETKATAKDKPTPLQEAEIEAIRRAKGTAMVIHIDNLEELEKWLLT